jgi:hypothetical protein
MWHKERLLNLIIRWIPDSYDLVAWIDSDVLFPDPNWPTQVSDLLEQHALVQLFEQALLLDAAGRAESRCPGVAYRWRLDQSTALDIGVGDGKSHPGLAWAARRDFIATYGLFDQMVVGGGDTMLVVAAYGAWDHWHARVLPEGLRQAWRRWAEPFNGALDADVGYLPTSIMHLWHGDTSKRKYTERLSILSGHHFDPEMDLQASPDALWEWSSNKDEMHAEIADYFLGRESMEAL